MRLLKPCLLLAISLFVAACQSTPGRPPAMIVDNGHSGGSALAASPDSRRVAAGDWRGWVRLWALEDGAPLAAWRAHDGSVNGLLFLGDGERILTGGYDGTMALWTAGGRLLRQWPAGSPVTALAAASAAAHIVTGHADGGVRLWDTDGTLLDVWPRVHRGKVRAVATDDDNTRIAAAGTDRQVAFWAVDGGTPRHLERPPTDARALIFAPQGNELIGSGWFELFRWQLPGGSLQRVATAHRGIINDLAWLPDNRLATISRETDSAVLLLDPRSGETLERLQRHDLCGVAVAPTADGRFLATTSDDATVRIWRLGPPPADSLNR